MRDSLTMILPLVLLVAIMYFLLIRPQKKREKQVTAMRNAVKVGDEVVTIGGIRGKIVKTKDEILSIQVGSDKMKFDIMRWAISKVENPSDQPITKATEEEAPKKKVAPKKMTKSSKEDKKAKEDKEPEPKKASAKPKKITKTE